MLVSKSRMNEETERAGQIIHMYILRIRLLLDGLTYLSSSVDRDPAYNQ